MKENNKDNDFENFEYKFKETRSKLFTASMFGMIRGVDMNIHIQLLDTMKDFNKIFFDYLSSDKFNDNNLKIMDSYLKQGIQIIKDIIEG